MLKKLLLLLVIAVVVVSCSDNGTDPKVIVIHPKTGSYYSFDNYNTDSLTGAPIEDSRDTSVMTFIRTGISFQGKSDVSEITDVDRDGTDTVYINYESNGDISMLLPDFMGSTSKWYTLPISSKTSSTITLIDTTITTPLPMQTKVTMKTEYDGTSTMTVKGQTLNLVKIKQTLTSSMTALGVTQEDSNISYIFVAPSIGFLAKLEQLNVSVAGMKSEGSMSTLIDYDLKQ